MQRSNVRRQRRNPGCVLLIPTLDVVRIFQRRAAGWAGQSVDDFGLQHLDLALPVSDGNLGVDFGIGHFCEFGIKCGAVAFKHRGSDRSLLPHLVSVGNLPEFERCGELVPQRLDGRCGKFRLRLQVLQNLKGFQRVVRQSDNRALIFLAGDDLRGLLVVPGLVGFDVGINRSLLCLRFGKVLGNRLRQRRFRWLLRHLRNVCFKLLEAGLQHVGRADHQLVRDQVKQAIKQVEVCETFDQLGQRLVAFFEGAAQATLVGEQEFVAGGEVAAEHVGSKRADLILTRDDNLASLNNLSAGLPPRERKLAPVESTIKFDLQILNRLTPRHDVL